MPTDPIDARCSHCGEPPSRCECVMNNPSVLSRDALLIRAQCARTVLAAAITDRDAARRELEELRGRRCETCRWWGPTGPKPKPRTSGHKTLWVGECLNAKQEPPGPQNGMWARADGCDDAGELYCEATHGCAAYERRRRAQTAEADAVETMVLSERDSRAFLDALANPPEPNDALLRAAREYADLAREGDAQVSPTQVHSESEGVS